MPKIKDNLTLEQLKKVMGFVMEGDTAHESIVAAVHSLLQRPENIFYRDIGHGRAIWVARNNTIICARTPKPMAWYLGGCRWNRVWALPYSALSAAGRLALSRARVACFSWRLHAKSDIITSGLRLSSRRPRTDFPRATIAPSS